MNYMNRLLISIIISAFFIGCSSNPKDEINNILYHMSEYEYENALVLIDDFENKYGDFDYTGYNAYILRFGCYESMGKYDDLEEKAQKAIKHKKSNNFSKMTGFHVYDLFFVYTFFKTYQFEKYLNIFDRFKKMQEIALDENMAKNFFENEEDYLKYSYRIHFFMQIDIEITVVVFSILENKNKKIDKERLKNRINNFYEYLFESYSYERVRYAILKLLDFKMVDDIYYTDILWEMDITKEYFKKFHKEGMLKDNSLEDIKQKAFRKDLPESFVKLFDKK